MTTDCGVSSPGLKSESRAPQNRHRKGTQLQSTLHSRETDAPGRVSGVFFFSFFFEGAKKSICPKSSRSLAARGTTAGRVHRPERTRRIDGRVAGLCMNHRRARVAVTQPAFSQRPRRAPAKRCGFLLLVVFLVGLRGGKTQVKKPPAVVSLWRPWGEVTYSAPPDAGRDGGVYTTGPGEAEPGLVMGPFVASGFFFQHVHRFMSHKPRPCLARPAAFKGRLQPSRAWRDRHILIFAGSVGTANRRPPKPSGGHHGPDRRPPTVLSEDGPRRRGLQRGFWGPTPSRPRLSAASHA